MDEANRATANAITFEVKKDGLTQRQSGDWQLRFTVQSVDMDNRLTQAPMGTRFQCVLVEVNDDESPRDYKAEERDKWRELGATRQSAIRCKQPWFWAFLSEEKSLDVTDEATAAHYVRMLCGVPTRKEFDMPGKQEQRLKWHTLDNEYQAWVVRERARS